MRACAQAELEDGTREKAAAMLPRERLEVFGLGELLAGVGSSLTREQLGEALGSRVRGYGWRCGDRAVYRSWFGGPELHVELSECATEDLAFGLAVLDCAADLEDQAFRVQWQATGGRCCPKQADRLEVQRVPGRKVAVCFVELDANERLVVARSDAPSSWKWRGYVDVSHLESMHEPEALELVRAPGVGRSKHFERLVLVWAEPESSRQAIVMRGQVAALAMKLGPRRLLPWAPEGKGGIVVETLELLSPERDPEFVPNYEGDPLVAEVLGELALPWRTLTPAELARALPRSHITTIGGVEYHDDADSPAEHGDGWREAVVVEEPLVGASDRAKVIAHRALMRRQAEGFKAAKRCAIVWGGHREGGAW